jgi:hypothetical protein
MSDFHSKEVTASCNELSVKYFKYYRTTGLQISHSCLADVAVNCIVIKVNGIPFNTFNNDDLINEIQTKYKDEQITIEYYPKLRVEETSNRKSLWGKQKSLLKKRKSF